MGKFIDLTGQKFGKLTVLSRAENRYGKPAWNCMCDCGNPKTTAAKTLKDGQVISCGCAYTDAAIRRPVKHGYSRKGNMHYLYRIWSGMKSRCYNPKATRYDMYGGRGIKVCDRWLGSEGFINFAADMGHRPTKSHSVDREENSLGYSPDNCAWKTPKQQSRNMRSNVFIEHDGKKMCLMDWADHFKLDSSVIHSRVKYLRKKGLPLSLALYPEGETPLQRIARMGLTIQKLTQAQEKSEQAVRPRS